MRFHYLHQSRATLKILTKCMQTPLTGCMLHYLANQRQYKKFVNGTKIALFHNCSTKKLTNVLLLLPSPHAVHCSHRPSFGWKIFNFMSAISFLPLSSLNAAHRGCAKLCKVPSKFRQLLFYCLVLGEKITLMQLQAEFCNVLRQTSLDMIVESNQVSVEQNNFWADVTLYLRGS